MTRSCPLLIPQTPGYQMTQRSGRWRPGLFQKYTLNIIIVFTNQCVCIMCFCVCCNSKEPGQTRVRRWGFRIDEVLKDPIGREQFLKFLESEFSSENLR